MITKINIIELMIARVGGVAANIQTTNKQTTYLYKLNTNLTG